MVLRQAMTTASLGFAIGGVAGFAFCWWIQDFNGIQRPMEIVALSRAAAILLAALLLASIVPAIRAARLNPIARLKDE
jgi:ABC-type antimicrobial peptide transport system permease subunit